MAIVPFDAFKEKCYSLYDNQGDLLTGSFTPNVRTRIKVEAVNVDMVRIRKMRDRLKRQEREQFEHDYGNLLSLLDVQVDWGCIQAVLKFWDPHYHCFSFNHGVDLMPTLEEYSRMLDWSTPIYSIYHNVCRGSHEVKTKLDKYMLLISSVKENEYVWYLPRIEEAFDMAGGINRVRILAFAIVGLVLFPRMIGIVDFEAANVFHEMETNKINPSTAILAETFRAFDRYRQLGKGKFTCCPQLFTIWLMSHFKQAPQQSIFSMSYCSKDPLHSAIYAISEDIGKKEWKMEDKEVWIDRFMHMSEEEIKERAVWLRSVNPIVSLEGLLWVPLIGARGCVSYCPSLVLGQFGIEQIIPATFGMMDLGPNHKEAYQYIAIIRQSWERPYCLERRPQRVHRTPEYVQWRKNRVNGVVLPYPKDARPIEEVGESQVDGSNHLTHEQLLEELHLLQNDRNMLILERESWIQEKRNLEFRVIELERANQGSGGMSFMNQEWVETESRDRMDAENRKRKTQDKGKGIVIEEQTYYERNQAYGGRLEALEEEVARQRMEIAQMTRIEHDLRIQLGQKKARRYSPFSPERQFPVSYAPEDILPYQHPPEPRFPPGDSFINP